MHKSQIQSHLKDLIIRNNREVLQVLRKIFDNNKGRLKEVLMLLANLNRLDENRRKGLLLPADEGLQFNQINNSIIELIDLISEEEAAAYELEHSIFQHILVVCKSPERKEYMQSLFPHNYYKELLVDATGVPFPKEETNAFDLVIFDNYPTGEKDDPNELLTYYLTETSPYILYFGATLPLLYGYPEKVYFTNSVFSIHARIKEMIEYLKYKQSVKEQ
ncbi:MAG: hypothetical protein R2828_01375 [Saprospiraceae bacterium]